jgi:RNA polymerase sigma-70 factor (ECF subfamily)
MVSADDVLQEVFLQAFRSISRFEARAGGTFGGWLTAIADARLADAVRREQRMKRGGHARRAGGDAPRRFPSAVILNAITSPHSRPSSVAARGEAISAVQVAVASLPDAQRDAVQVHLVRGKSLADTAAAMGRTEDAVRGLIHRAKGNLRSALGRSSQWLFKRG